MKLKEFFKPNTKKLIITLVVTVVWILFWRLLVSSIEAECKMCPDYWPDNCPGGNYVNYLIIPKICSCCVSSSELYNDYLWNLILPLIISYLISCIVIWIYNKVKKK